MIPTYQIIDFTNPDNPRAYSLKFKSLDAALGVVMNLKKADTLSYVVKPTEYIERYNIPEHKKPLRGAMRTSKYKYDTSMTFTNQKRFRRQIQRRNERYKHLRISFSGHIDKGLPQKSLTVPQIIEHGGLFDLYSHCFKLGRMGAFIYLCADSDQIHLVKKGPVLAYVRCFVLDVAGKWLTYDYLTIYKEDLIYPVSFWDFLSKYTKMYSGIRDKSTYYRMGYYGGTSFG